MFSRMIQSCNLSLCFVSTFSISVLFEDLKHSISNMCECVAGVQLPFASPSSLQLLDFVASELISVHSTCQRNLSIQLSAREWTRHTWKFNTCASHWLSAKWISPKSNDEMGEKQKQRKPRLRVIVDVNGPLSRNFTILCCRRDGFRTLDAYCTEL